jgi:hypothetical protein
MNCLASHFFSWYLHQPGQVNKVYITFSCLSVKSNCATAAQYANVAKKELPQFVPTVSASTSIFKTNPKVKPFLRQ